MEIARVEGEKNLEALRGYLKSIIRMIEYQDAFRVRFAIDSDGVKFKVNESIWSPGIGTRGN